ncbi:glycosyltransferase [Streptomyces pathocidini]|uniref:Glycosyltransferase n=1 Tax=Streptomyces pathocidini TaxID=1650571 RepID=A0ABW7UPA9_9ACTN|nr:glycosyltransferase [Streptomyces pathocidini]
MASETPASAPKAKGKGKGKAQAKPAPKPAPGRGGKPPARRAAPRPAYGEIGLWLLGVALCTVLGLWLIGPRGPLTIALYLCLVCFAVSGLRTLTLVRAATKSTMQRAGWRRSVPPARHRVTVIVPCHNEESVVDRLVRSLLDLDYPRELLQLVIVDDGSQDSTLEKLSVWQKRHPDRLQVLHRPPGHGGKSGALNHATRYATGEVIVVYDADHTPEPNALRYLAACFDNPRVGAAQGRCVIANGHDGILAQLVAVDYLGGYIIGEQGRSAYTGMPSYGGSNCAVRRSVLDDMGGWSERSLTEDTDLTLRVMLAGHEVQYEPDALDYEEAVTTPMAYWRQRRRWATGHQQVCRDYLPEILRHRGISPLQKLELVYYLVIYHLPLLSLFALVCGLFVPVFPQELVPISVALWPVLFYGPLMQLGVALVATRAPLRRYLLLPAYFPLYVLGLLIVAKAWVDGITGRAGGWAKTARSGDDIPQPVPVEEVGTPDRPPAGEADDTAVSGQPPSEAHIERRDRFGRAHGKKASSRARRGLSSSVRWAAPATFLVLVVGLVCYFVVKDPVREFEGMASLKLTHLLAPSLEAWADGPGVFIRRDSEGGSVLYLRITSSCSVGPLFLAAAAIATSMRSIVRIPYLLGGLAGCVALVFLGNILRISLLTVLADKLPKSELIAIHDTVAALFSLGFVIGGLIALFAIAAPGSKVHLAS